jgi:hypothetical protein
LGQLWARCVHGFPAWPTDGPQTQADPSGRIPKQYC